MPAVNALKIFLLLVLGLAYALGLGWLVVGPLLHGSFTRRKREISARHEIPLALLSGLILNYGLLLAVQSLRVSLVTGGVLAGLGLGAYGVYAYRRLHEQKPTSAWLDAWVGSLFLSLLYLGLVLAEPLRDWDARSIWFFQSKMIYSAGTLGLAAGWQNPAVFFTHADYPKLVGALGAQVAYVFGFWNEYLPKAAVFFMLVPGILWLFTFSRRSFSFVILLALIPLGFYRWIWNGYMDGFLALYFSIAMLLFGRYLRTSQAVDLVSSAACLFALLYLKNEGALATVTGLGLILLFSFFRARPYGLNNVFKIPGKYYLAGFFALLPWLLWSFLKQQWSLSNDLGIGTSQSLVNILSRLQDGSYILVLKHVYSQLEGALLLLGLLVPAALVWKKPLVKESLPALLAAGIYGLGMIVVYLLTPHDLTWHLETSVARTMLVVNGLLFAGSFFLLQSIEDTSL